MLSEASLCAMLNQFSVTVILQPRDFVAACSPGCHAHGFSSEADVFCWEGSRGYQRPRPSITTSMDYTTLSGLDVAVCYARCGRFIFAIKHLEKKNPGIARKDAIAVVASFGYRAQYRHGESEWPDSLEESHIRVL